MSVVAIYYFLVRDLIELYGKAFLSLRLYCDSFHQGRDRDLYFIDTFIRLKNPRLEEMSIRTVIYWTAWKSATYRQMMWKS